VRFKTIIVDDESYARQELIHQLEAYDCFDIAAQCHNAVEGVKEVNKHNPDVIFLDIQMPGVSGFDMLSMLEETKIPLVVFVTAYDEYALKAFEENSLDYLLKPIEPKRLDQTVERIKLSMNQDDRPSYDIQPLKKIPCTLSNVIRLVDTESIDYVFSDITGVRVMTEGQSCLSDLSLKAIEERTNMFRCHRQYLVNVDRIKEIKLLDNGAAEISTASPDVVPVSRRLLKDLKTRVGLK
jgi:two-component system LytT family response regulator